MQDSKSFVDRPLKASVEKVLEEFAKLPPGTTREEYSAFMDQWMFPPGYEVEAVTPTDWQENPAFVRKLPNELKPIGNALHAKWLDLVRRFEVTGLCDDCYSSTPVPNPFVVAGGRFREFYYWDSYWCVQGLLVSGMNTTARHVVDNLLYMVNKYGFVPNGGRIYYLNRSQPPLLTLMVKMLHDQIGDTHWLHSAMNTLEAEYKFWTNMKSIYVDDLRGKKWVLQRYYAVTFLPRPESYKEDIATCHRTSPSDPAETYCYRNLASGAESGWDFSSRWLADWDQLRTIRTQSVIPVDLNSILYRVETTMAGLYTTLGNSTRANYWLSLAATRRQAIRNIFWSDFTGIWNDYITETSRTNDAFYVSNLLPVWAGAHHQSPQEVLKVFKMLWPKIFFPNGGIPTSIIMSRQQWDFPNAWAPLQQFVLDALDDLHLPEATKMADQLAVAWFNTNYCAWKATEKQGGLFFEKYDVLKPGQAGGGGEYVVQDGFGWTNGVMLKLLQTRSHLLKIPDCSKIESSKL